MDPNIQDQPVQYPVQAPPQSSSASKTPSRNSYLRWIKYLALGLVLALLLSGTYILGKNAVKTNTETVANISTTLTPTNLPTVTSPTSAANNEDEIANWKKYQSPIIADYFSPFQLSYPSEWTIKEEINQSEPKSLTLTLTNSKNETIEILQAAGGGGACIYKDDVDYDSFQGMGDKYSTYVQITKPALWRLTKLNDTSNIGYLVCQKSKKGRYFGSTEIGWISINASSDDSLHEAKSILETIVFKPTSTTKTIFN